MAEVHLAIERLAHGAERLVVIKRILPAYKHDPDYVEFFIHEARVALQLVHPNVVQAYEFGRADDVHYLAMEYLPGATSLDLLRRAAQLGRHLSLDALCKIVADVAAALDHVHRACDTQGQPLRIVHRDVSPHNIVIAREGIAKLVDFGIARATTQEFRTRTGVIKGKFAYLAPEQVRRGQAFDHRADLWALGVVTYELLTRRPLFRGASDADTVRRILGGRIPPLRELRADCPAPLAAVVHRLLEREPAARYQSGADLLADLEEAARMSGLFPTVTRLRAEFEALYDDGAPTSIWSQPPRALPRATPASALGADASPPRPGSASGRAATPPPPPVLPPAFEPTPVTAAEGVPRKRPASTGAPPEPLPAAPRLSSPSFGQMFAEPIPDQQLEYFLRLASARRARAETVGTDAFDPRLVSADPGVSFDDLLIEPESDVHAADGELLAILAQAEDTDPQSEPSLRLGDSASGLGAEPLPLPAPPHLTPAPELQPRTELGAELGRDLGRDLGRATRPWPARPSSDAGAWPAATPGCPRAISASLHPEPLADHLARRRRRRAFLAGAAALLLVSLCLFAWLAWP
jgi:serine/threonine-protein kinase